MQQLLKQLKTTSQPIIKIMSRGVLTAGLMALTGATSTCSLRAQAAVYPTDVVNIAAAANGGRIVSVSSTIDNDPKYNANNLIDGQVLSAANTKASAGWASNKFDPVAMDTVTFGFKDNAMKNIGKVVINPAAALAPERWAKDVEVQVSTDSADGPYRPIAQITLRKEAKPQEFLFLPTEARFVRLMFRSNWGSDRAVALGEVEIYQAIGKDDPIGLVIAHLESAVTDLKRFRQTQIEGGNPGGEMASSGLNEATLQLIQNESASTRLPVSATNIALVKNGGRIVDSSSTYVSDPAQGPDPDYKPENLINGENYTGKDGDTFGWASQGFTPGKQFVTVGFKDDRTRLISKIIINPSSYQSDLRWARRIDVQVSADSATKGPFRTVATLNLRPEPTNQDFLIRPVEAKYVRFVFLANGPGGISIPNADPDVNSDRSVSLGEIEIYEATASGQVLDTLVTRFEQVLLELKTLRSRGDVTTTETTAVDKPNVANS